MFLCTTLYVSTALSQAKFEGDFIFEWLSEPGNQHREMKLASRVKFLDNEGKSWEVPADSIVDGASIPRLLWTFAGSPFVGNYRRASVIHDYFCDIKTTGAEKIHRMFREAMIVDGVNELEAGIKHTAVVIYGKTIGKCGKPKDPVPEFFHRLDTAAIEESDLGFSVTAGLENQLNNLDAMKETKFFKELDLSNQRAFANSATKTAKSKYPKMLQAMVDYSLDSNKETLATMESAIRDANPSLEEIEAHALLAKAAIPRK